MGWRGALLLMQASGLSRNGWFHCWAMFTLLLQGKGFLEGTTLPPIMIYLGPAGLPKKKENTYSKDWKKHYFLSWHSDPILHIDFEPTLHRHEHFHISYLI